MGIVSQVIVASKASGLGRQGEQTSQSNMLQYVANVGLKVNHKLGGANMRIRSLGDSVEQAPPIWSSKPTMLIGMDVSHPQSFDASEPSIVGIVASMDKCASPSDHHVHS
jgi:eukaryotic translation initiation factor 2C